MDKVGFTIDKGQTYALVGESGSGKSTIAKMIVGLETPDSGRIRIDGQTVFDEAGGQTQDAGLRQKLQMVFQSPYSSLNPRWRVGDILLEPIRAFRPDRRSWFAAGAGARTSGAGRHVGAGRGALSA